MEIIGVIGLGKMGRPMARRLLQAGHTLIVANRSQAAVQELVAMGARPARSPADLASQVDIVVTSLPDSPAVQSICLGENGILHGARSGSLLIDTSTIHPETTRHIAESLSAAGVEMLDAPVSGGEPGAIAGTLSIMVGGPESAFRRALPVLERLGQTVTHMGPAGSGQLTKLANQIVVALHYAGLAEGLVFGTKAGLDPQKLLHALEGGLAQSRCMDQKGERILDGNYEPGGRLTLHIKDLQYALDTAKCYGIPLPVTSIVEQFFEATRAAGRGSWDHSAIVTLFEDLAGIKIRRRTS